MNAKKELPSSEHSHPKGLEICPYLKWRNDETIRYGFSHVSNFCYKPKKAQPVKLSYQKPVCLTGKYTDCPVFQQENIKQLPHDIRGKNIFKKEILRGSPLLMIILILILGIITVHFILSMSRNPSLPTQNPLSIPTQNLSNNSATLSNTGIPVTSSAGIDSDKMSPLRLNTTLTSGPIWDSNFIPETIYNQNEDSSQVIYSDMRGKNLYSIFVSQPVLRSEYIYDIVYLEIP